MTKKSMKGFSKLSKEAKMEWITILFYIDLVFMAELFNSSIEYLTDFVCKKKTKLFVK